MPGGPPSLRGCLRGRALGPSREQRLPVGGGAAASVDICVCGWWRRRNEGDRLSGNKGNRDPEAAIIAADGLLSLQQQRERKRQIETQERDTNSLHTPDQMSERQWCRS